MSTFSKVISIPSGAIKRLIALGAAAQAAAFQFLLVRLRGTWKLAEISTVDISIPSGAIKRSIGAAVTIAPAISIPSGAIKRSKQPNQNLILIHFNSFWCD